MKNLLILVLLAFSSCTSTIRYTTEISSSKNEFNKENAKELYGKASFYADKFAGRLTANGETFSQSKFTAAHKSLPFGTNVRVENLKNGLTVDVRINDRGPFVRGRIIDLSKIAAEKIKMIKDGIVDVKVTILN